MKKISLVPCLKVLLLVPAFSMVGITDSRAVTMQHKKNWTPQSAVAFALHNSPSTQIALARIEQAEAASRYTHSANDPIISLHAGYSMTNNPMYSFGNILNHGAFDNSINFNDPGLTDALSLSADISYRIYNGGRNEASIAAADAITSSNKNQLEVVQNTLAFEVVKGYHNIIQAKDMLQAQEEFYKAIEASLQVAHARFEEGDLLKEDLLNLEVQKAKAIENTITARHKVQLSERTFLNLLGLKDGEVEINCTSSPQEPPQQLSYINRPELKIIEKQIEAAQAEIKKAEGAKLPTVDSFANYQFDHGTQFDGSGDSWQAGIKLDYKLFQGKQTEAKIAMAKSKLSQLQQKKAKTHLDLNLELQQAELGFKQAKERLEVTGKMVDVAEESARLSRIRFKEGVILSSQLIDVETRLSDARLRQSMAKASYHIAISNLLRTTGTPQFPAPETKGK